MKSKKSDCYSTPNYLRKIFSGYYDPCPISNGELRNNDGLGDWKDKTFVNPPYSNPLPWVLKAIEENKKGKEIILLLKCDPSTNVYRILHENKAHILLFNERIKFNGKTPNFPSMLAILESKEFYRSN